MKAECINCPYGYLFFLKDSVIREIQDYLNAKIAIYDIDVVLEAEKKIQGIIEWKKLSKVPKTFNVPMFEYVGLKKIAKLMRVQPYIVFQVGDGLNAEDFKYYVIELDRFEKGREIKKIPKLGKCAVFKHEEAKEMDYKSFRSFILKILFKEYINGR